MAYLSDAPCSCAVGGRYRDTPPTFFGGDSKQDADDGARQKLWDGIFFEPFWSNIRGRGVERKVQSSPGVHDRQNADEVHASKDVASMTFCSSRRSSGLRCAMNLMTRALSSNFFM